MRNNVIELLARKARKAGRKRITVRAAAQEMGVSYYTLSAIVNNTVREYPAAVLGKMCDYLECNVGDLLSWEVVASTIPASE